MPQKPLAGRQRQCEVCGADIPKARLEAIPEAHTCVRCQRALEKAPWKATSNNQGTDPDLGEQAPAHLRVEESRVVVGGWSKGIMELAAEDATFRRLMRAGHAQEARALVRSLPVEGQAALVVLDENPEEVLSLTAMSEPGVPAYSPGVVDLLPSEMLARLIAYRTDEEAFNVRLMRAMTPQTFRRTVEDVLDLVDDPGRRVQVSWEWLRALAALDDAEHRAALVRSVDPAVLEEALLDRLKHLDMHAVISSGESSIYFFRLFSEEAAEGVRPSMFVEDLETGLVLDAVFEAAPEVLRDIVRGAWERQD